MFDSYRIIHKKKTFESFVKGLKCKLTSMCCHGYKNQSDTEKTLLNVTFLFPNTR